MIVRSFLLLFTAIVAITSQSAYARVNSDEIKATVNRFMDTHIKQLSANYGGNVRIEYRIRSLDPRLAMADCPAPLVTQLKSVNTMGSINIKVSCQQQQLWSLYVPVDIDLFRPVVIAVNPIARGSMLQALHLELREKNISRLTGSYFTDMDGVIGMQAKRPLNADQPIIAQHIEPPLMIKKGESVLMTAQSSGLIVKIPGIALSNGHKGQQISVRNKQSKRVVEAKVSAPGQVIVPM